MSSLGLPPSSYRVSGSLLGRALGVGLVEIWKALEETDYPVNTVYWDWLDPGLVAVIGSASMLGGVTRLAIASTVFMVCFLLWSNGQFSVVFQVEMSRDIELTIPIMVAAFVARTVGEALSKSLWRHLTDIKGLPVLEQDPKIVLNDRLWVHYERLCYSSLNYCLCRVSLELFEACDIMTSPVKSIRCIESVGTLCRMLLSMSHGAIPVVRYDPETRHELAYGLITRWRKHLPLITSSPLYF
jgi:chloride channel 7